MIDREMRIDIMVAVRQAMVKIAEEQAEVWITENELLDTFHNLSPGWLKRYRSALPRTRIVVEDADGVKHETSWVYPRNTLQRMALNGDFKRLKI